METPHKLLTGAAFRKNPEYAAVYLESVLEYCDQQELRFALRRLIDAFGGLQKLAATAKLDAKDIARTLSPLTSPELHTTNILLKAMGLRLAVQVIGKTERSEPNNGSDL
ncbi:MAG: addiction module antidote protein [Candidatus Obscuribacterales bacterium]|nr:addiction module antidote protein [Steroidobacteraceae bacterium]